ncbi:MAG TPA: signal peptidase II [Jatrophihabitans sp.]|nr:signal peptidase II [Jatrophihabitans sp.]
MPSAPSEPNDAAAAPAPARGKRVGVCVAVAALVLILDVVSKLLVVANLPLGHPPVRLLGGVLYLNQARNSGAAFSLGTGFTVILTVIALVVVVVIARTAGKLRSTGWAVALGLILGGALGNLADRVLRAPGVLRGHVVDWISLFGPYDKYWPIFNIADSAIVCGAILAALLALLGRDLEGRRPRRG